MTTGERTNPYLGFRFQVELSGLVVGGFSEVGGLGVELGTESYEEGGTNGFTHVLPTRVTHPNVVLERGVTDSTELFEWVAEARRGPPDRKTGLILLLDSTGVPVRGWQFLDGYPVRWDGPDLGADRGAVAVERLEIAHHGFEGFAV